MAYIPNPQDSTKPTTADLAGNMAAELQSLKGYLQSLVVAGNNFYSIGGLRNRLKNGSFQVAQRGTTLTNGSGVVAYTLDQWICYSLGGPATVNQLTNNALTVNGKALQIVAGGGSTVLQLSNIIEGSDCNDLAMGTVITVSGYIKIPSLTNAPNIQLFTPTVFDNWFTSIAVAPAVPMTLTGFVANTWMYFSQQFTLANDCSNGLKLLFGWGAESFIPIAFSNVQLEKGSYATSFDYRPMQLELAQCQRYYQSGLLTIQQYGLATSNVYFPVPFTTSMRVAPTITSNFTSAVNVTSPQVLVWTVGLSIAAVVTATAVYQLILTYTASAEM